MFAKDYNASARLLHRLALAAPSVSEAAFDLEKVLFKPAPDSTGRHVFVSGLARSGTTLLLRLLAATDQFASLTYRDMPFVMAPNLWARINGGTVKHSSMAERAHGDGVMIDFDSPEALEEVFWRVMAGDLYLRPDRLVRMKADADLITHFRNYVALIAKRYNRPRYLSKNNNNVVRLESVAEAFPQATIIIPFRDPLQQAHSLLLQHRRFSAADDFTASYMTWLAHHEFGRGQRPFSFSPTTPKHDPGLLDYWVWLWIEVYGSLVKRMAALPSSLCLSYENLCASPTRVWSSLRAALALPETSAPIPLKIEKAAEYDVTVSDAALLDRAKEVYEDLLLLSRRRLNLETI